MEELMSVRTSKRLAAGLITAVATAAMVVTAVEQAAAADDGTVRNAGGDAIKDSYLVVLKTGTSVSASDTLAGTYGASVRNTFRHALNGFSATMDEKQAVRLAADPAVAYVEQDHVVRLAATQDNPPSWGLDRVDERPLPLDGKYTYDTTASAVTVYVIDTGIRITHHEFGGRASYGRDTVNDDNVASDCNGHGTHVAGTVGGATYGVAKGVHLIAVKALNCEGHGTVSSIVEGVDWVTAHHVTPAVANMSLTRDGSDAIDDAVRGSIADGVTYAIAAGNNDGRDACEKTPARVGPAITVGATDENDTRYSVSNIGPCVDVFAPGRYITSAVNTSDTASDEKSGTSMATPHVAGAAALFLAKRPSATPGQVQEAIVENATFGRLANVGSGSPNRLLYRPYGPVVTGFWCGTLSGLRCTMSHAFGTGTVSVRWYVNGTHRPAFDGRLSINESCTPQSPVTVRSTVTAANGATEANAFVICGENG
jgi:subtilisin family serine protease